MTAKKKLDPQSMGRLGGLARAKKLSKKQRSAIARLGGLAAKRNQRKEA